MTQSTGQTAIPVTEGDPGDVVQGGAALRVYRDDAAPTVGGSAQRIYIVDDAEAATRGIQGNTPIPVAFVTGRAVVGGSAIPVYVVNGVVAPDAPASLTATPTGTQVALDWPDVPDADNYNVYRITGAGVPNTLIASNVLVSTYTDTGLATGTLYTYAVTAVNSGGESGQSPTASATTIANPPATLVVDPATTTSVSLTWAASTGATSYNIYRAALNGTPVGPPLATSILVTTYTDSALASPMHTYAVSAVNTAGESALSSSATTLCAFGAWFDRLRSSVLFQDTARTTPATTGDPVGAWFDPTSTRNATQATAGNRPAVTATGVTFTSTDPDFLSFTGVSLGTSYTVYVVANKTASITLRYAVGGSGPTSGMFFSADFGWFDGTTARSGVAANGAAVWAASSAGQTYRNNVQIATGAAFANAVTLNTIGRRGDNNFPFDSEIRAVLLYTGVHDAAQRAAITALLRARHGV